MILDEAGVFDSVGRVELVEEEIYVTSPIHRPHAVTGEYTGRSDYAFGGSVRSATIDGLITDTAALG